MRILFVPCSAGGFSHQIPLYVLSQRIQSLKAEFAFLLPASMHDTFRKKNVSLINMDFKGSLDEELAVYKHFQPDIVVDDLSPNTLFATQLYPATRIAIQRTGIFTALTSHKPDHRHSGDNFQSFPDMSHMGFKNIQHFSDFFSSEIKIVPGVRSIEVLPQQISNDTGCYFSGPLNMEDYLPDNIREIFEKFFHTNKDRIKVYFTFGLVAVASEAIVRSIKFLLENDVAIVTNIPVEDLNEEQRERYIFSRFVPINFVCAHSDLVIHHCGSGMYHYPILNEKPSITIGTMCYDREEVALQLQQLEVSRHLPSPMECEDFETQFKDLFHYYKNNPANFSSSEKMSVLKAEIERTMLDFSFGEVLDHAQLKTLK